jgi:hypothetical protein
METNFADSPDFARYVYYRTQSICDNTLDDAQLETRCPLDNGQHNCTSISPRFAPGQLDRLPLEVLIEVLLRLDVPLLTRFRSLNRRTMELVNSRFTNTSQSSSIALTSSAPLSASKQTHLTAVHCTGRFVQADAPHATTLATISIL